MTGHVCQVISDLGMGGAEKYVVQLSSYLHIKGYRVSVMAGEPQPLRTQFDSNIHVETVQMHPGPGRSALAYLVMLVPTIRRMVRYFRQERVSLVHTHLTASALPTWIAAKLCGIPVMHSKMHAWNIASGYQRVVFGLRLHRALVDRFLVFSRYSEQEVLEQWHVPADRILLSSIGIDTDQFCPNAALRAKTRHDFGLGERDRVLLAVARLHPHKDVELAIRAARCLDDPMTVLLIAGDGEQRAYLQALAAELPGRTRVVFLGLVEDLRPIYASGDLLLQTTQSPDMGMSVLEAMACAVPIIIAYRDAEERKMAENTFDGEGLGAIAAAHPEAIASMIRSLWDDPAHLASLRDNLRPFAEQRHSRQRSYEKVAGEYRRMIR